MTALGAYRRPGMDDRLLRVPASRQQGHGAITNAPAAHLPANLAHLASTLEAENGGRTGGRRIETHAL
jgi:hypothetical protein